MPARSHGHSRGRKVSRTYAAWQNMRQRCYNPNRPDFKYYGGRHVEVCPEWRMSFAAFLHDMGECPSRYTLERKNVHRGYTPENCVWASWKRQQNNRRNNHQICFQGATHTIAEWAGILGVSEYRIRNHIKHFPGSTVLQFLYEEQNALSARVA